MNRNIRNLVVIVTITVIALFILTACATISPSAPQGIRGQYAGIGQGMALMAPFGFKPNSTTACIDTPQGPACPSVYQTSSGEGVFSFDKDGTGSLTSLVSFSYRIFSRTFRNGPSQCRDTESVNEVPLYHH